MVAEVDPPPAAASEKSVPVPVRGTIWGLPMALSVIDTLAVRPPAAVGLKTSEIMQFAPAARVAGFMGQVDVSGKSAVLDPVITMLAIVNAALPVLVSVMNCAGPLVVTSWLGKLSSKANGSKAMEA